MKLSVKDLELKGQRVFIRVDFNVPLKNGTIGDDTRIKSSLPTIQYALEQGATVVLASHLGRPKGKPNPEMSLKPVADRLAELRSTRDQSKAREGLKRLQEELTCERLRPSVTAALKKIEKPEPVFQQRDREESRKSAARHRNEEAKPSRQRAKREESRPEPRVRQEARTAPVRHNVGGGGGGGGMIGVGF